MLIQMVSAGIGVAALPNWAIDNFVQQRLIVSKLLGKGLWRRLFVVVRASEHKHHYLNAFFQRLNNSASSIGKVLKRFNTLHKCQCYLFELIIQWIIVIALLSHFVRKFSFT